MNKIMVGTILTVGLCLNIGNTNASDWTLGKNDTTADAEYKLVFGVQYPGITSNIAAEISALIALLNDINDRKDISAATKSQAVKIAKSLKALREYLAAFNERLKEAKLNGTATNAVEKSWLTLDTSVNLITQETANLGFAQSLVCRFASLLQLISTITLLKADDEATEIHIIAVHIYNELNALWAASKQINPAISTTPLASRVQAALTAGQNFATAAIPAATATTAATTAATLAATLAATPAATPVATPAATPAATLQATRRK
ncbi:MAG: hypothetical protein LBJ96_02690 [Holosporaceae bacterium]|jgi:hypothetical protein|nr:hypothetical protein [Holosporaceae bacterium]